MMGVNKKPPAITTSGSLTNKFNSILSQVLCTEVVCLMSKSPMPDQFAISLMNLMRISLSSSSV